MNIHKDDYCTFLCTPCLRQDWTYMYYKYMRLDVRKTWCNMELYASTKIQLMRELSKRICCIHDIYAVCDMYQLNAFHAYQGCISNTLDKMLIILRAQPEGLSTHYRMFPVFTPGRHGRGDLQACVYRGLYVCRLYSVWILGYKSVYSETCMRRSPLGPDQLAVVQRWPAYKVCVEIS